MIDICNKKSGVYGLSGGLSSDFRDLGQAAEDGNELAKATLETYSYRVAKYIGSYVAAMNGVDVIAFTAGVGENNFSVREAVLSYFGYLGIQVDKEKNSIRGEEVIISKPDSKIKVYLIPTNEELMIAKETLRLIK